MRILVLGVYYSNNLGDGVICECVASNLKRHFPESRVEICDLLDRATFERETEYSIRKLEYLKMRVELRHFVTKYTFWDKELDSERIRLAAHREHIHEICEKTWDIVVFAGGQMFMDRYALILKEYVNLFSAKHIPVFFNACGEGPTYSHYIQKQFSKTLNSPYVRWISSRDDVQRINTLYMHRQKKAIETYDPALWAPEVYEIQKQKESQIVGLGMMYLNGFSLKKVTSFWVHLIKVLEKEKIPWRIFVNGATDDIVFAQHVFSKLPELEGNFEDYLIQVPERPMELVEMISGFKSIISCRLHSHIIATALDVPSVALVWDKKLNFFFEKIEHKERCMTIKERPEQIIGKLKRAEKEGYNQKIIKEQKVYADNLLYEQIKIERGLQMSKDKILVGSNHGTTL